MSGQESFYFSTLPHHPAGCRQTCRTRLSVGKSIEATTPHGPATWLASCVLAVARRFECSEVAQTGYGACASDRRSVGAWTERAPNLRGREGSPWGVAIQDCGCLEGSKKNFSGRNRLCQGVIFDSLVEWDSILLHAVEEWSGSNAAIDGFVIFDLGGCKIAVTAISIRSREKVGSVEGIGGVYSGRAPDLALRSLDSGWLAAHRTKDREISR